MAEWVRATVPKFSGSKGAELSTGTGDDTPGAQVVTVYLPKAAALETEERRTSMRNCGESLEAKCGQRQTPHDRSGWLTPRGT